jgi:hydrogenase expression/formation protein HypC
VCLGIPGQVVDWVDESDMLARVDVLGVTRNINVGLVREDGLELGDWVLIHVGFAMSVIDEDEAALAMDGLRLLGEQFDQEIEEIARSRIE